MPRKRIDDQFPRLSGEQFGKRLKQIRLNKNISVATAAEKNRSRRNVYTAT